MHRALVREPGEDLVRCELTWIERDAIEVARARASHRDYVQALRGAGLEVTVLPALAGHPDAPFVEDAVVVLPEMIVLGRPSAPGRRGELDSVLPFLPTDRPRLHLPEDALLDGGDVLVVGREILVGISTRTNSRAIGVLADAVELCGYRLHAIPVKGALHLKTAVTAASNELLVARIDALDAVALRRAMDSDTELLEVAPDEPAGANLLALPGGRILISESAPKTAQSLRERGLEVVTVELREFEKAEAGPTCLSIIW